MVTHLTNNKDGAFLKLLNKYKQRQYCWQAIHVINIVVVTSVFQRLFLLKKLISC